MVRIEPAPPRVSVCDNERRKVWCHVQRMPPVSPARQSVRMAKLKDIVFDCVHAAELAGSWPAALEDYAIQPYADDEIRRLAAFGLTPATDPSVMVDGPTGSLCFQEVPEPKSGRAVCMSI